PVLSYFISGPRDRSAGWAITAARVEDGVRTFEPRKQLLELKRASLRKLDAGATLRIEIAASTESMAKKELEKDSDEPRRQDLHFPDGDGGGVYELRVTSGGGSERRKVLEGDWDGESLTSPPVRIEMRE